MKTLYFFLAFCVIAVSSGGAGTAVTKQQPGTYSADAVLGLRAESPQQKSLFSSDSALLSDDDIKRILGHRFLSYCTVEAVLLDTRSGIVPFTATASRDFIAEKSDADLNLIETMRRVELDALRETLGEIGDKVVDFLE